MNPTRQRTIDEMKLSVTRIMTARRMFPELREDALLAEWPKATGQIWHECATEGKR